MAERSEVKPIELLGWTGGLNREADPYQVELNETPDALNVDFGLRGAVRKRKGYSQYAVVPASDFIFEWDGTVFYVLETGQVKYLVGTTDTDTVTTDFDVPSTPRDYACVTASMGGKVYLTTIRVATGSPITFDGTTWAHIFSTDFDGTSSRFPRARSLVQAHNRIFAGNVRDSAGTDFRSRVHFSNLLDAETWSANDWFDVAPDDGTEITGMALFGDQIIIFKDRSVHALVGTDTTEFGVFPIDEEVGTVAPGTITNVGLKLAFFDHLTGVWMFDGADFDLISEKINTYLLDNVNLAEVHKSAGWTYKNKYYLSVPWGTDTDNSRTFVYDTRTGAWTEYDFGFADATTDGSTPLAIGVNGGADIMQLFSGTSDNGANINGYLATAWLSPSSPSYQHRLRRLDLTVSALGNYDMEVIMRRNFQQDSYKTKTVVTETGAAEYGSAVFGEDIYGLGLDQITDQASGWGGRWRACQLEFADRTQEEFQINRAIALISSTVRTRGTT